MSTTIFSLVIYVSLDRSLIDNSTLLLNKRNLYKYDIIIIIIF